MQIHIKATRLELTPIIERYIERRIGGLQRFVKRFEKERQVHIFFEIARTTRHHKSGDVFYAEATVDLPGKTIRAERRDTDIRAAVDNIKNLLKRDILEYKEKKVEYRRSARK